MVHEKFEIVKWRWVGYFILLLLLFFLDSTLFSRKLYLKNLLVILIFIGFVFDGHTLAYFLQ